MVGAVLAISDIKQDTSYLSTSVDEQVLVVTILATAYVNTTLDVRMASRSPAVR